MTTRLVLVGAGHPHLLVLEAMAQRNHAIDAILVTAASTQAYSPMVPGLVEGRYRSEELEVDLAALARAAGAKVIGEQAERIDATDGAVVLAGGHRIAYDVASLAVDSDVGGIDLPGVREHALLVKPGDRAAAIAPALERAAQQGQPEPLRVIVVGAGVTGVEIALATRGRLDRLQVPRAVVTVLEAGHTIVRDHHASSREQIRRALARNDVTVRLGAPVTAVGADHVRLASGEVQTCDVLIWAAGAQAPKLFQASGLPTDKNGYLLVDNTLRAVGTSNLFGSGDGASLRDFPSTPRAALSNAQAGAVLAHNLAEARRLPAGKGAGKAGSDAASYRSYRPPRRRGLELLNTGDGRAILSYGALTLASEWAMELKDRIDRGYVKRLRRPGARL